MRDSESEGDEQLVVGRQGEGDRDRGNENIDLPLI